MEERNYNNGYNHVITLYYVRWDSWERKIIKFPCARVIEREDCFKVLFPDDFMEILKQDSVEFGNCGKYYPLNILNEKCFITFPKVQTFKTIEEAEIKLGKINKTENIKDILL